MEAVLGEAYSVAYGLVNSALIRLQYPAAACLLYLLFELLLPRTRNSMRSYGRAAVFTSAAIIINTILLAVIEGTAGIGQKSGGIVGEGQVRPIASLDLTPLTASDVLPLEVAGWIAARRRHAGQLLLLLAIELSEVLRIAGDKPVSRHPLEVRRLQLDGVVAETLDGVAFALGRQVVADRVLVDHP